MRVVPKYTIISITLLVLTAMLCIYWPEEQSFVPKPLWGVWKTDHDRYADRYLDISEAIFTIGQGGEKLQVLFVQRVETAPAGDWERFTLHYIDQEGDSAPLQTMSFFFQHHSNGRRIRLQNQDSILWYPESKDRRDHAEPRGTAP